MIPKSIEIFICNSNKLTFLPELPDSLKTFNYSNNPLIKTVKHKYLLKIIYM